MIYLDSASTTKISEPVFEAMVPWLTNNYGNPSSHHELGRRAKDAIEEARVIIAAAINASPEEIYFTSGGTEANNWAIKGLRNRYNVRKTHIISSCIEHHSITEALKNRWNEVNDILYTLVPVDHNGIVDPEVIADNFRLNTRLVSIMYTNNELGTVQPIKEIAAKCKDNGILFHTDAVQAFGHVPIDVKESGINLLSASGHKLNGPKGVGFLYISKDYERQYMPLINGGQQERGLRASTENVASIVGFGEATKIAVQNMEVNTSHCKELLSHLMLNLKNISAVTLNSDPSLGDSRHVNIRIDGIRGEQILGMLDAQGIFVSSGSACNSNSKEPSHVLKAIGLTDEQANSSIRISLDENITITDLEIFIKCLKFNIQTGRKQ